MNLLKTAKEIDPRAVEQIKANLAKYVSDALAKLNQAVQKTQKSVEESNAAAMQSVIQELAGYIDTELAKLQTIIVTPPAGK